MIYGLGAMGRVGKETTWHFTLNRTAGSLIKSHWNLQAGLRIGF